MTKELYESQIAKEAAKRFHMLCEYSFQTIQEDGEEDNQVGMEDMDMGDMDTGVEPAATNNIPQGETEEAPNMEQSPDMNNGAPGFNPQEGMNETPDMPNTEPTMGEMPNMEAETMEPEDEVIDVEELTQSQENTENKVDDINVTMEKGFEKLLGIVSKLDKMIDSSTANMESIKKEIEKRNPTPMEKLNMRAANDSYPFNIKPDDYWKEKEATSNYRIGGEDEDDATQYTITQGDIDSITDFNRIAQELNSSSFNQNLMNVFGLR